MAKVLIAEDDQRLAQLIQDSLQAAHHLVDLAANGEEAYHLLSISKYDVIVLDWEMPLLSGVEVCKRFRSKGGKTPILMLTGKDKIVDKEAGFDSGADDYLTKPFDFKELNLRIRALTRRSAEVVSDILEYRGLRLDVTKATVSINGTTIDIAPREFALLAFLMRHPDQPFSAEALQQRVWSGDTETTADTIKVHIARLRSKIDRDQSSKSYISTARKIGYAFDTTQS